MSSRLVIFAFGAWASGAALAQDAPETHPAYWGAPSVDGGACCANLLEARGHIDEIDRKLIELMARREKFVAEAGRFKINPAAVSAPARVEAIVAEVRSIAIEDGLSPDVAERTFRAMIAAFEDYERDAWAKRNPAGAAAPAK